MRKENKQGRITRRGLLTGLLTGWAMVSAIPVVSVLLRFLTPTASSAPAVESIELPDYGDIVKDSAKVVRFGKQPAIVIHTPAGQYKAFMARCTHLGCVVKYEGGEEVPRLHCNCHGSIFDLNGKNISGPAPRPLDPLRVNIKGESLVISTATRA